MKIIALIFYRIFAMHLPISYSKLSFGSRGIRGWCGKKILTRCGKNVNIEKNAIFSSLVELGDNSDLGINSRLYGKVIIGKDVMMGPNCTIYSVNHKFDNVDIPMNRQGFQDMKTVIIGNDVWIGGNVIILPGVKIGDGVVIGAGSVVTKDVLSYSVVAGNPARVIRMRK